TDSHGNLIEISSDEALGRLWDLFREPRLESAARLPEQLRRWMADALTSHFERGESTVRGSLHYELKAPNGETLRAFLLPGSPHGLHTLALERCESPETTGIRTLADKLGLSRRRAQALYWV